MNAGQRSARRLANIPSSRDTICTSCLHRLSKQHRTYAAAAAAVAEQPDEPTNYQPPPPPVTQTGPRKAYRLLASPVLSRPPLITRELTPFEKAFYLYQKRLNERLALPFQRYFYYKEGTPAGVEWKRKRLARKSAARDIGLYSGYGDEAWNDEVLVGDETAEPGKVVEALIRDAEGKEIFEGKRVGDAETGGDEVSGEAKEGKGVRKGVSQQQQMAVERPQPRITKADETNDLRSLNRKLDRVLYLLVKRKDGSWRFPQDRVYGRENLHQAAERTLIQAAGINMNTWMVGNHPIGHHISTFMPQVSEVLPNPMVPTSPPKFELEELGEKVFFMKGRIMAGQADLSKNEYGDQDFHWLTKEEIRETVASDYYRSVRSMLTER